MTNLPNRAGQQQDTIDSLRKEVTRLREALTNLVLAIEQEGEIDHYNQVIKGCVTEASNAIMRVESR